MKKQWISIKCGLSRDPKHRRAMANSIWLFMHMIDIADWETGIIHDWTDTGAAEEMEMELRTLREQRRDLESDGYITCTQKQYGQDIVIHNWTNPREYTGQVYNEKRGYKKMSPQKAASQGYIQGYIQGSIKNGTPTYSPKNQITIKEEEEDGRAKKSANATLYEQEIGALTPLIADALADAEKTYPIEWIPEAIKIAVERNARNWKYILMVLKNAKNAGKRPSLNKLDGKNSKAGRDSSTIKGQTDNADIIRKVAQQNANR